MAITVRQQGLTLTYFRTHGEPDEFECALDAAGARVVRHIEVCLHLDHAFAPLNETISQRFSLERGGHSWISTCWPTWAALFASWA